MTLNYVIFRNQKKSLSHKIIYDKHIIKQKISEIDDVLVSKTQAQ